jgi:aspartate carbamoyltransferase catalytic subunit
MSEALLVKTRNKLTETKKLNHLLSIKELSRDDILSLIDQAQQFLHSDDASSALKNKIVANLFFEMSTRTRSSFEIAAKRLGAEVLNFDSTTSSLGKGETVLDTVLNLEAMGVHCFVIRHQEERIVEGIASHLKQAQVINAGDGCHEHPTQALLDMLTIFHYRKNFQQLKIAIVGDILHSRVAHSVLTACLSLEVPDIRLVGPKTLLPDHIELPGVSLHAEIESGIKDVDVVMVLRLQKERMESQLLSGISQYATSYGLNSARLKLAKPDAIVMHPGPVNRDIEITSEVIEGPQSVILQQTRFGVAMRMAILNRLLA